jgi:hypothetical protein
MSLGIYSSQPSLQDHNTTGPLCEGSLASQSFSAVQLASVRRFKLQLKALQSAYPSRTNFHDLAVATHGAFDRVLTNSPRFMVASDLGHTFSPIRYLQHYQGRAVLAPFRPTTPNSLPNLSPPTHSYIHAFELIDSDGTDGKAARVWSPLLILDRDALSALRVDRISGDLTVSFQENTSATCQREMSRILLRLSGIMRLSSHDPIHSLIYGFTSRAVASHMDDAMFSHVKSPLYTHPRRPEYSQLFPDVEQADLRCTVAPIERLSMVVLRDIFKQLYQTQPTIKNALIRHAAEVVDGCNSILRDANDNERLKTSRALLYILQIYATNLDLILPLTDQEWRTRQTSEKQTVHTLLTEFFTLCGETRGNGIETMQDLVYSTPNAVNSGWLKFDLLNAAKFITRYCNIMRQLGFIDDELWSLNADLSREQSTPV